MIRRLGRGGGEDVDPIRVAIGHSAPARTGVHRAFFRGPVAFDAGHDQVLYPRHVLEIAPRQANRALWSYLCAQAQSSIGELAPQPLAAKVQGELATSLAAGVVPRVADLAARLGTSERSLRRQLSAGALGFRELLDHERRRRARELLARADVSITRAALELGFADASAFAHACQRWFSASPGELRGASRGA